MMAKNNVRFGRRDEKLKVSKDWKLEYLKNGIEPRKPGLGWAEVYFTREEALKTLWSENRKHLVKQWRKAHPGKRPFGWWKYEAPEPRDRVRGIGAELHKCTPIGQVYEFGIPTMFLDDFHTEIVERCGKTLADYEFYDDNNPPAYEAQATYLERHGLLTPDEKRRLKPKDFEPEFVED
jgi:hypothetical protein